MSLLVAIGLEIWLQSWQLLFITSLALILSYIPVLIERNYKINLPVEFEVIIIVFVYGAMFLGEGLNFYARFWWWDSLLHISSGVVLGFWGFLILYLLNQQQKLRAKPLTLAIFAFGFSLAGGAIWEIFEFSMDKIFGTNMQKNGLNDTMWDLIVDAAGGLAVSAFGYWYLKKPGGGPLHRFVHNFLRDNPHLKLPGK